MPELTNTVKEFYLKTANDLKGSAKRVFMAQVASLHGGISFVAKEFQWCRATIQKGKKELVNGPIEDKFSARGRKKSEILFPNLLEDIKKIVDCQSQTDPSFKSCRLYTRLTAKEVRKQLLDQGYDNKTLPCVRTISTKLNDLGYNLKKVQKAKPLKKNEETDQIFDEVHKVNKEADDNPKEIRISMDAKARMNIGNFSRGGRNRVLTKAEDHDLGVKTKLTNFGFYLPQYNDLYYFFSKGYPTSDFIVDRIEEIWPEIQEKYGVEILTINADNGPENSSSRTQFIRRLVEFAEKTQTTVNLAYYPPYHSKYNPIERVWGIYENHIKGDIMDSVKTTLEFAKSMTYNGKHPVVKLVEQTYEKGVKLTKKAMEKYNKFVDRLPKLEKWFLTIRPGCTD